MRDNYNLWYQPRIISILLISVVFISLLYITLYNEMNECRDSLIENWTDWQKKMVDSEVNDALQRGEDIDNYIVDKAVPELKFNEASYVVFYRDNTVIFENNREITLRHKGQSVRSVYGAYSYQGGYNLLEVLEQIEQGKSGKGYFVKNHFKGKEYITWTAFEKDGSVYILGSVTAESYILSLHDFAGRQNWIYAFSYIYTFLMVLFAVLLIFSLYKYKKTVSRFEKQTETNLNLIARQKQTISDLNEQFKSLSIYDFLTGLYNRRFFDVFFPKIEAEVFTPVSIALIDVGGLKAINNTYGYAKGDEVLVMVADTCREVCDENDVIVRYNDDKFAVIMISTSGEEAKEAVSEIAEKVSEKSIDGLTVKIFYGIGTKASENDDIYEVLSVAEQNLKANKPGAGQQPGERREI